MKQVFRYDRHDAELLLIKITDNGWVTVRLRCGGKSWDLGWDGRRLAKNRSADALQKYSPTLRAAAVNALHQWCALDQHIFQTAKSAGGGI